MSSLTDFDVMERYEGSNGKALPRVTLPGRNDGAQGEVWEPGFPKPGASGSSDFCRTTPADGAPTVSLIDLSAVDPKPILWLWPGRIALGKLTMLAGDPGTGKSCLSCDLASRTSTGIGWPDGAACERGGVVLMSAEDDVEDTIVPRLIAASADRSMIRAVEGIAFHDETGTPRERPLTLDELGHVREAIEATPDCRLLVIDPISAFLPPGNDGHNNAEVRGLLAPLARLAAETCVAVVMVSHLNKSSGGKAMYRTMGSLAFNAAARASWLVTKDKDDPARRLFLPVKNNIGPDCSGLAYRLENHGHGIVVAWEADAIATTADDALGEGGPRAVAHDEAAQFIAECLAGGPKHWDEIEADGVLGGHAKWTLVSARKAVAECIREPGARGRWLWQLRVQTPITKSTKEDLRSPNKPKEG